APMRSPVARDFVPCVRETSNLALVDVKSICRNRDGHLHPVDREDIEHRSSFGFPILLASVYVPCQADQSRGIPPPTRPFAPPREFHARDGSGNMYRVQQGQGMGGKQGPRERDPSAETLRGYATQVSRRYHTSAPDGHSRIPGI